MESLIDPCNSRASFKVFLTSMFVGCYFTCMQWEGFIELKVNICNARVSFLRDIYNLKSFEVQGIFSWIIDSSSSAL